MIADAPTPTHPGGVIDESALERGWRLGVADAWKLLSERIAVRDLTALEELGNAGPPPAGLVERHGKRL